MAAALLDTGGMSLPSFANANLTEAIPREGGGGDIKLKLLSLTRIDQRSGVFFYQKGPVSLLFSLPLKLILHFLKANLRRNGESCHKIR